MKNMVEAFAVKDSKVFRAITISCFMAQASAIKNQNYLQQYCLLSHVVLAPASCNSKAVLSLQGLEH